MSRMTVTVGGSTWGIDSKDVDAVVEQIQAAMQNGTVAVLPLLDDDHRPVTVYLNGRVAETVAVDLDEESRPSEIS